MIELGLGDFYSASSSSAASVQSSRVDMSEQQRKDCMNELLHKAEGDNLPTGTQAELAQKYGVSRWTIYRIWKSVKKSLEQRQQLRPSKNYKGNVGRKRIAVSEQDIMELPLRKRCNIRSLASALKVSKSSVHRLVKCGKVRRHSSTLKPTLTLKNKIQRLRFCFEQLNPTTVNTEPRFKDMFNVVHVDEKWFLMSKTSQNFYLAPGEINPHRTTKHKSHICKVMFLVAVCRPWFGENGEVLFDGKIGCFPLTEVVPAKRSSRLRPRGTLETKPIKTINQAVIRDIFVNKLLPAIKAKWPLGGDGNIYIQQDNATPHIMNDDLDFHRAANSDGFNITLLSQPPNSPDLNGLDLGFFNSIQSIQHQQMPTTVDELVNAVHYVFECMDAKLLNKVFLSYQYVMREVMKVGGGNNYNLPHAAKDRLMREGRLPTAVEVPTQLILQAMRDLLVQHAEYQASLVQSHNVEPIQAEQVEEQQPALEENNGNQYYAVEEYAHNEVDALQAELGELHII